jgi:hypothetical protein
MTFISLYYYSFSLTDYDIYLPLLLQLQIEIETMKNAIDQDRNNSQKMVGVLANETLMVNGVCFYVVVFPSYLRKIGMLV